MLPSMESRAPMYKLCASALHDFAFPNVSITSNSGHLSLHAVFLGEQSSFEREEKLNCLETAPMADPMALKTAMSCYCPPIKASAVSINLKEGYPWREHKLIK